MPQQTVVSGMDQKNQDYIISLENQYAHQIKEFNFDNEDL